LATTADTLPLRDTLPALIASAGGSRCALPLASVTEVMRMLPLTALTGLPEYVLGITTIRDAAVPVLQLDKLLGHTISRNPERLILLTVAKRKVALAVDSIAGIRQLHLAPLSELPPLLQSVNTRLVDALGTLDAQLLIVLNAARIVPDEVWTELDARARELTVQERAS